MDSKSHIRQNVVRWIWLLIIALSMMEIYRLIGIRFTTNDDAMALIWYQSIWHSTLDAMQRYGRIQNLIYWPLSIFALRFEGSWIYDLLHYGTLAAAHAAAVYVAVLYLGVRFAALLALIYVTTIALVWEYNLFTSYPLTAFFSILVADLSLVALNFYRRSGSRWLAALSLLLLTFAFFSYEFMPFIFTALYIACLFQGVSIRNLWAEEGTTAPEFRLAAAALGLLIFYLTAYFAFNAAWPSHFQSNQFNRNFRLHAFLQTTINFSTRSSIYAWIWTPYTFSVSDFFSGTSVTYSTALPAGFLTSGRILAHLPKAVLSGFTAFLLLRSPIRQRWGILAGASAIGLLIIFLPNMFIASTARYQQWHEEGHQYYVTTTLSHFGFALLAASSLVAALQALERHRLMQSAVRFASIILLAVGGLYSSYANTVVAKSMQANTGRWRGFDLIMQTPKMVQVVHGKTVVAPKLWNNYWNVLSPPDYWTEFAKARYGENIEFRGRLNNSGFETAIFFDFFDDPKCGGIFALLAELSSKSSDYTATRLHIATTRSPSNSFLSYRSVDGKEQIFALRSVFKGATTATLATEPFDPRSLYISCAPASP
jgi:hypothetical protein